MALSEKERDRIADEIYRDHIIVASVYCGRCGYDLRSLPYIHTCPECGQEYNARPLVMKGIFMPHMAEVPIREVLLLIVCGTGAALLLGSGFNPVDIWRLLFGLILAGGCAMEAGNAYLKVVACWKSRVIQRRIERREREESGLD